MTTITTFNDPSGEGTIKVNADKSTLENGAKVTFTSDGNILIVEDGVRISGGSINFNGTGSLVYLSRNRHPYLLNLTIHPGTCVFFGPDTYLNGRLTAITSERQNILIGGYGLFSFGIFMRTADPHLIYDCKTRVRINSSKSILIGDHVWLGQNSLLLKGTHIGSGSIVAAGSIMSGKKQPSNTVFGGNPARFIKGGVFFSSQSVHAWSEEKTKQHFVADSDFGVFEHAEETIDYSLIDQKIIACNSVEEKLQVVKDYLVGDPVSCKNRFYLPARQ